VFTSATNSALPLPVTAELTTRTHGISLDALHLQPEIVETDTLNRPPSGGTREDELPSWKRHGVASWVTGILFALTMSAVDRSAAAGFSDTSTLTAASPWPEFGRTCIHDASLSIVHGQSRFVETVADRRAADDGSDDGRPATAAWHFVAWSGPVIWVTLLSVQPEIASATAIETQDPRNLRP
jgi:hypothetical protein